MATTSASKGNHGGDDPPTDVKRVRASLEQEENKTNASESVSYGSYQRLKNVRLPDEIAALSHVLNFYDTLLMALLPTISFHFNGFAFGVVYWHHLASTLTNDETNDLKWVQQRLDRFPCDYSDVTAHAAALSWLDIVN
ncbi:hypothetical protein P3T76_007263 [Phytophthora citrophthora]|uniref:Uncharacterized protein n=1 Tax=Phytophthora citrophthora TaxID=4793 RepID=A0AAD9GMX2_9STRA|nr:hypothetical protein P3T76_007263 [Phytophthora citrophthora]